MCYNLLKYIVSIVGYLKKIFFYQFFPFRIVDIQAKIYCVSSLPLLFHPPSCSEKKTKNIPTIIKPVGPLCGSDLIKESLLKAPMSEWCFHLMIRLQ